VVIPPPFASLPSVLDLRRPEIVDLAVAAQPATSGAPV
jgi:hypothetical protein